MAKQPVHGVAPVLDARARVLILGSMPGARSLAEQKYYAHPRNAFWPIIERLTSIRANAPYELRLTQLLDKGLGLWDVLAECVRPGSLDQRIQRDSIGVNDFGSVFEECSCIERIVFNGRAAATLYDRHVLAGLRDQGVDIERVVLPSTSPAHAAMSFEAKCTAWREALQPFLRGPQ